MCLSLKILTDIILLIFFMLINYFIIIYRHIFTEGIHDNLRGLCYPRSVSERWDLQTYLKRLVIIYVIIT